MSLGVAALECGVLTTPERWLSESLAYNRALKDTFAIGYALVYLGQALSLQGRRADALDCPRRALALATLRRARPNYSRDSSTGLTRCLRREAVN